MKRAAVMLFVFAAACAAADDARVARLRAGESSQAHSLTVSEVRFDAPSNTSSRGVEAAITVVNSGDKPVKFRYTVRYFSHTRAALLYSLEDHAPMSLEAGQALLIRHTCPFHTARSAALEISLADTKAAQRK